jgi:putative ABC transport system permease protein
MISNYLKIAFRNIRKHKIYSIINILGLAIGIAFCILTYLFIKFEWSFDRFHDKVDRIYLVRVDNETIEDRKPTGSTPPILASVLLDNLPEIEEAVRVYGWGIMDGTPVRYGEKVFNKGGFYVESSFFKVFSFPHVAGDLENSLNDIDSVVITTEMADQFFGNDDPMDKRLSIRIGDEMKNYLVRGIVELPQNSSLRFDYLLSNKIMGTKLGGWGSNNVYTYLLLSNQADPAALETKFRSFFTEYFSKQTADRTYYTGGNSGLLRLISLKKMYLNTVIREWLTRQSDPLFSYILAGIALSVLLIACVNFMNISLGLSSTRFKEVGIRKVVGAKRIQLIKQFWGESVSLTFFSLLCGLAMAVSVMPVFSALVQRSLSFSLGSTWIVLFGIAFLVGIITGSFPAFVLSSFHPIEAFRGRLKMKGGSLFSRILVAIQFVLSVFFIISTLLMSKQMSFLRDIDLGLDRDQVLVLEMGGLGVGLNDAELNRLFEVFRQTKEQYPSIVDHTMANMSFAKGGAGTSGEIDGETFSIATFVIDYNFFKTLGIELVEGRPFSEEFTADEAESILINESLARKLKWDRIIGRKLDVSEMSSISKRIIGVVKDFHFRSLHEEVIPAAFSLKKGNGTLKYLFLKIKPDNLLATLSVVKTAWEKALVDKPFVYSFLDDEVNRVFSEDERWVTVSRYSAAFAIFISCLGVFGLTSLSVARRKKEVGIRKTLGATVPSVVKLISLEFTRLVILANILAWPLVYFVVHGWLQNFAYRIRPGLDTFVIGGILALTVSWLSVSYQSFKAALADPVESLRHE